VRYLAIRDWNPKPVIMGTPGDWVTLEKTVHPDLGFLRALDSEDSEQGTALISLLPRLKGMYLENFGTLTSEALSILGKLNSDSLCHISLQRAQVRSFDALLRVFPRLTSLHLQDVDFATKSTLTSRIEDSEILTVHHHTEFGQHGRSNIFLPVYGTKVRHFTLSYSTSRGDVDVTTFDVQRLVEHIPVSIESFTIWSEMLIGEEAAQEEKDPVVSEYCKGCIDVCFP
jgi:hypothetical protein